MIYFSKAGNFLKIGHTDTPKTRMNDIQVGCPYELELVAYCSGGRREEAMFHELASRFHHRAEWFRFEGELMTWLMGDDSLIATMQHGDGFVDYCFRSELDGEKLLEEWCRENGRDYDPPTISEGPKITRHSTDVNRFAFPLGL